MYGFTALRFAPLPTAYGAELSPTPFDASSQARSSRFARIRGLSQASWRLHALANATASPPCPLSWILEEPSCRLNPRDFERSKGSSANSSWIQVPCLFTRTPLSKPSAFFNEHVMPRRITMSMSCWLEFARTAVIVAILEFMTWPHAGHCQRQRDDARSHSPGALPREAMPENSPLPVCALKVCAERSSHEEPRHPI